MSDISSGYCPVTRYLNRIAQDQATGTLLLSNHHHQWRLIFSSGQLLYSSSKQHRVRRWHRALHYHKCEDAMKAFQSSSGIWELNLLYQALKQGKLSLRQLQDIITQVSVENLYAIACHRRLIIHWRTDQGYTRSHLNGIEIEPLWQKVIGLRTQLEQLNVSYVCPDLAPILNQTKVSVSEGYSDTTLNLTRNFNGDNTVWDICLNMRQSVVTLSRVLHHFLKRDLIHLQRISDLPPPIRVQRRPQEVERFRPLIACIDDSPLVCRILESILRPAGYRVLKIQDPLQAVSLLTQHKPALIFLDLIMPNVDGHSLCTFLRNSQVFKDTPIIILTSHDHFIDWTRAKWAGATEFMSKTTDAQTILQVVEKYLSYQSFLGKGKSN